jgi:hypothetical protein
MNPISPCDALIHGRKPSGEDLRPGCVTALKRAGALASGTVLYPAETRERRLCDGF